jgi:hypothetical protein
MGDLLVEAPDTLACLLIADRENENDDEQTVEKEQQEHKPALVAHAQLISELGEPAAGEPPLKLKAWGPGHSF